MKVSNDFATIILSAASEFISNLKVDGMPPVCFAVADRTGTLMFLFRMEGAPERLVQIAIGKAYTAARMMVSTNSFKCRIAKDGLSLADFCDDDFTALPGGVPIIDGTMVIGAVGMSGRKIAEDHELAENLTRLIESALPRVDS